MHLMLDILAFNYGDAFFWFIFRIVDWKGKLLLDINSPVSSAERRNRPFIAIGISFIYNTNNTGPDPTLTLKVQQK